MMTPKIVRESYQNLVVKKSLNIYLAYFTRQLMSHTISYAS